MTPSPQRRKSFNPNAAIGGAQGGLFDATASRAASPKPQVDAATAIPLAETPTEITVAELSALVQGALEGIGGSLRVIGELSNVSERTHLYFSLKGEGATISAVMWASDLARNRMRLQDGQLVVATGRLTHYAPQGRTQFSVTKLEQAGVGDRELELQALLAELKLAGYFDASRKRRLPAFPKRVAIVTSRTGAAIEDVLKTARTRSTLVEFVVFDVRVQGEGAAADVAATMRFISANHQALGVDVMLVTRGGGSREDLWSFNERIVADAAFTSRIPVVSAIGHEEDTSVLDHVADLRASTPTQAVLSIVPDRESLREQLGQLERRFTRARATTHAAARLELRAFAQRVPAVLAARFAMERRRLDALAERCAQHSPRAASAAARALLLGLERRCEASMCRRLTAEHTRLEALQLRRAKGIEAHITRATTALTSVARRLNAVNPRSVLARGYSVVFSTTAYGRAVVKRSTDVTSGTQVEVETGDGAFNARVE